MTLSDKITDQTDSRIGECIVVGDVKEFINKLKGKLEDDLRVGCEYDGQVNWIIDKLAGDKLIN